MHSRAEDLHARVKPTVILAQASHMDCQLLGMTVERQCRLRVLACVVNGDDMVRAVQEMKPELVLISARLQDGAYAGLRAAQELHRSSIVAKTIVLLDSDERELVVESFRCGAKGVFTREQSSKLLCKCVSAVLHGEIWASNKQMGYLVDALAELPWAVHSSSTGLGSLTKRENEVLRLIAAGLSNREISKRLALNESTVKNYVSAIFEKLGVSTRVELVLHFFSERAHPVSSEQTEPAARENSAKKFGT